MTFSALADETRLALVEHLLARGELPAGDLVERAGLSAPSVSRHLKVLRRAGVLRQRAEGTKRLYSVRPEALREISDWTARHRAFWEAGLDRLGELLAENPQGEED